MIFIRQPGRTCRIPRSRTPITEADILAAAEDILRCTRTRLTDGGYARREFTPSPELQSAGTDTAGRSTGRIHLPRPRRAACRRSGRSVIGVAIADAGGAGSDTSNAGLSLA